MLGAFRSIRWNFLTWLFIVQALGLGGFGGALYYLTRSAKLDEVDGDIEAAGELLAAWLRRPPPPPRRGPGGPGPGPAGGPGPGPFFGPDPRKPDPWRGPPPDAGSDLPGNSGDVASSSSAGVDFPRRRPDAPPRGRPPGDSRGESRGGEWREPGNLELPESLERRFLPDQPGAFFAVWRSDGSLLRQIHLPEATARPAAPEPPRDRYFRDRGDLREIVLVTSRGSTILVGQSIASTQAELWRLKSYLEGAGGAVLALGLVGAWFIARRAIRPIEIITATAESISASDLSRRIDLSSTGRELGKLAVVLNRAFDRLQEAFERQARFTADASHELRTPLAVILTQTGAARRRERSVDDYKETIRACEAAARRMKSLVEGLLTLARDDAGDFRLERAEVDLRQIADECLDLLQPLAAERTIEIRRDLDAVRVDGDAQRLAQVVTNLATNAVLYNRPGGEVAVSLRPAGSETVLIFRDTGCGIAAENIPRIFDRFFRVDSARSSKDGGTGLGLAITKAIVEAHGGRISCASEIGKGSAFEVRLPLRAEGAAGPGD